MRTSTPGVRWKCPPLQEARALRLHAPAERVSPAEMEPRRSVRAEAKATELAANPKAAEVAAPAKPKPKLSKQKVADPPPDTWEFPTEGSAIEVEVENASGGTAWEKATVIAVLVDGTFQAQIKTKVRPPH